MGRSYPRCWTDQYADQQIPFDAFKARLIGLGTSEPMAKGMVDMMAAKNEGLDNMEPRTPQSTTPTSFRLWCVEVLKPALSRID